MARLILRRLLLAIPILIGVATVNFFVIHAVPGDAASLLMVEGMGDEQLTSLREAFGLDDPVPVQYLRYLEQTLLHGNFGYSLGGGHRAVSEILLEALPNTLLLAAAALAIQYGLGIALGVASALTRGSKLDGAIRIGSLALYSMPSFYLGLCLMFLFAGGIFHVLPSGGLRDLLGYDQMTTAQKLWNRGIHLVLPAVTLGVGSAAAIARLMRGELLDTSDQEYVRAAHARGLSPGRVVLRHQLRSALLPIATVFGVGLPVLFSGSVIVENVFSWPGMGRVAVVAAFARDYPVFLAASLVFALAVIVGNLIADVLYAVIDPRVRFDTSP